MTRVCVLFAGLALPTVLAFAQSEIAISAPTLVNGNGRTDGGNDLNPQVATDGEGLWLAVWHSFEDQDGKAGMDSDIFLARSRDNGRTWSAPALLNTNGESDSGSDELPKLATDGNGHWIAAWYSSEDIQGKAGNDTDILVATSADNGESWSAPALLNTNGDDDTGDDAWPQVTTDGKGTWIALWWSREDLNGTLGDDEDILTATSRDNGATWSDPVPFHAFAATDSGTDSEPRLTTDGKGHWVAVWRTTRSTKTESEADRDLMVVTSSNNGETWSEPALLNTNGDDDTGDDGYPHVATDGDGHWVAVWRSEEDLDGSAGTDRDILVATSRDHGRTWTAPRLLNGNGATDIGREEIPIVVTDGAGNWVVVWWSDEDVDGTAGTDNDVFFAHSEDNGAIWSPPALLNTTGRTDSGGDYVPHLAADGKGTWVAVWDSEDDAGGTVGTDSDIFSTSFFISIKPE